METITITITAQTLGTIGAALNELPYKVAQPAIKEIDDQVKAHLMAKKAKQDEGNAEGTRPSGPTSPDKV